MNIRSGTESAIFNKVNISTFEFSDDTQNRSKSDEQVESFSDDEDAAFVPFEYQGDGRKREAKRHKLQAMVAKDEIEIERMIREF